MGDEKLEMEGEVHIAVQVNLLTITGGASIGIDKNDEKHINFTKITTYSDFILREQPTTIFDAIELFKGISSHLGTKEDNYAASVPLKMTLIPLKRFCPETNQLAEEIAAHIMKTAADIRVELMGLLKKIERMMESPVAAVNFLIKRLLLDFHA